VTLATALGFKLAALDSAGLAARAVKRIGVAEKVQGVAVAARKAGNASKSLKAHGIALNATARSMNDTMRSAFP
jgi:cobalamin biosynthesis protein CobT